MKDVLAGPKRQPARFPPRPCFRPALGEVVERAMAADPGARYPSADELANALRLAARLAAPGGAEEGMVFPVLGLDGAAALLGAQIAGLREGGGIVITGPRDSGRSTLLRRIAWSLGMERPVAWVERGTIASEALEIELSALDADERGLAAAVGADRHDVPTGLE